MWVLDVPTAGPVGDHSFPRHQSRARHCCSLDHGSPALSVGGRIGICNDAVLDLLATVSC